MEHVMERAMVPQLTCKRCGYKWFPNIKLLLKNCPTCGSEIENPLPRRCPKCNSPYWNKERKKERKKE